MVCLHPKFEFQLFVPHVNRDVFGISFAGFATTTAAAFVTPSPILNGCCCLTSQSGFLYGDADLWILAKEVFNSSPLFGIFYSEVKIINLWFKNSIFNQVHYRSSTKP